MIYSGLRNSEALGIKWSDVNWDEKTIKITHAVKYTPETGIYCGNTKNASSQRILKLPEYVMAVLCKHKTEQYLAKEKLGSTWKDQGFVFTQINGKVMYPTTPYKWLKNNCEKKNIRFCGIHAIRHFNHMKTSL